MALNGPIAHPWLNRVQTVLLIGSMMLLLGLSARLLFGAAAFAWTAVMVGLMLVLTPRATPGMIMRLYRARPIALREAPRIHAVLESLAGQAGLPRTPQLFYVGSPLLNAFTAGRKGDAVIAVTDGMLRRLSLRELAGVLAHEISHIRNEDIRVMGLADVVSRLTASLAMIGQFLILVNLPLWLTGGPTMPWTGLLLLVAAPLIASLLQLALSRTREFEADQVAVRLTADPDGLISALAKIEVEQGRWIERMLWPGARDPNPSILRTHPPTADRIRRIRALEASQPRPPVAPTGSAVPVPPGFAPVTRRPRRHWSGLWY